MAGAGAYAGGKLLADVDQGIGLLTFNQPDKRNAVSVEMWQAVAEVLAAYADDPAVRVLVLTGAGPKAFTSGADISEFGRNRDSLAAQREYSRQTRPGRDALNKFPKPVIARIRGFCLGGGISIALEADLRIAGTDSTYGIPAARLGLGYAFGMIQKLVALIGPAHAKRLLLTGDRITAVEALRIGLVNEVVREEELSSRVVDLARQIADNAPLTVRAAKLAIDQAVMDPDRRDVAAVDQAISACFDSEDYREGRIAFMEKRMPKFQGR